MIFVANGFHLSLWHKQNGWMKVESLPERGVMRAIGMFRGSRLAVLALCLGFAGVCIRQASVVAEHRRAKADAERVFTSSAVGLAVALDALRPVDQLAAPYLQSEFDDPTADPVRRLHAACALAELGQTPLSYLLGAVSTAPAEECRNIIAALKHAKAIAVSYAGQHVDASTDATVKARLAIIALHLGDAGPAERLLAVSEDRLYRTTLIHLYQRWHGPVSDVVETLRTNADESFRSGLCAAIGLIPAETIEPAERESLADVLAELYRNAPDGGTHSAAGWALRAWKQPVPGIEHVPATSARRRWYVNGQGMTMIEIPPATFTMSPTSARAVIAGASVAQVTIGRPFFIGDRELTNEQFRRFIDDADYPASEKPANAQGAWRFDAPDLPVHYVNWYDAALYCNWLSKQEGKQPCYRRSGTKEALAEYRNGQHENVEYDRWDCDFANDGYRLPTEAEWEYACRANSATAFCFGDDDQLLTAYGWVINNSRSRTWPGGLKLPNAYGLFDVYGNVAEWCYDWYGNLDGAELEAVDPVGPSTGLGRVDRGGGWRNDAADCRLAYRDRPSERFSTLGFRLAHTSVEPRE